MGAFAAFAARDVRDEGVVRRMLDAVPHRGSSVETASVGSVSLGIRHDPELSDGFLFITESWAAAVTGRLDNGAELRADLRAEPGPTSDDPAEVLAAAIRAWGPEDAARRLRGALAFAVTDGQSLWVGGDHLGFRPIRYRVDGRGSVWSTEAQQVIAGTGLAREPDLDFLDALLFGGDGSSGATPLRGVSRLARATVATVRDGALVSTVRYWDPSPLVESLHIGRQEAEGRFVELARRAVERMVTGRDAVALSGGIDSPTIAAFAAEPHEERGGSPLVAVSAVFPDQPSVDERPYIEAVADRFGLDLHTYRPQARPLDDLSGWVARLDAPGSTLSMPEIAELYTTAREAGARTVMTGELAEYVYSLEYHTLGHLIRHGRWAGARRHVAGERGRGRSWASLAREMIRSLAPAPAYFWWARRQTMPALPPWMAWSRIAAHGDRSLVRGAGGRWISHQLEPLVVPHSLTFGDVDVCAAYSGVVVRYPLGDVDLWEFMLSLPAEVKYPEPSRKAFVRSALRGILPDVILDRRDKTFFNARAQETADYALLRDRIIESGHRLAGIDYPLLERRLEAGGLSVQELDAVNNLARVHVFLDQW